MSTTKINPCPHLPKVENKLPSTHTRPFRTECGPQFYLACLELAQSNIIFRKPSQAILQLNKSMMATIPSNHPILDQHPIPYTSLAWILKQPWDSTFLGNPVRHFQHLATRMSPTSPQPELRTWRAWASFHIATFILPSPNFPLDQKQITTENLQIPTKTETLKNLIKLSPHQTEITTIKNILTST